MRKVMFALALSALLVAPAQADSNFGVKLGRLSIDGDLSAATQAGLVYTFDIAGIVGAEVEANTSAKDGTFDVLGTPIDYKVTQLGGYGVLMSPGPFYVKAKAGMVYSTVTASGIPVTLDNGAKAAYGVGVGFELVGLVWEVEWTRTKIDTSNADLVSLSFKF